MENVYEEEFELKVLRSNKPVLIDFFADWCAPCKMLSPVLEELAAENSDFSFYKTNVDENPQLAAMFGINAIPAVLVFNNGKCVDKAIGYNTKEILQALISKAR